MRYPVQATDEQCTLPLSPPMGGTKTRFCYFFQYISNSVEKKSAKKFFCV